MTIEYVEAAFARTTSKRLHPRPVMVGAYALVPVNGKLPIGPIPISPVMLSPETLPVNSSVSGIGLVMETFQATSSPLAVPSKISVELPSAAWVPVSAPPAFFRVSVALRSPIGVLMVMFQFPSTAILSSPRVPLRKTGMVLGSGLASGGGIAHLAGYAQSYGKERSGAGGANPVGDEDTKRDILHGESRDFPPDRNHRDIQRPQFHI